MHGRMFILAMRAGATVMLEAMNIQIWKQTAMTLHMRILAQPRWFAIIGIDASMPPSTL
jgi:hypothetical protein